jgi:hypothetical protein
MAVVTTYYQDLQPDPRGFPRGYQTSTDGVNWVQTLYPVGTFGPGTPSTGSAGYSAGLTQDGVGGADGLGGQLVQVAENDPVSAAWKFIKATGRIGVFAPQVLRINEYS